MPAQLITSKENYILQLIISHPEKKGALTPPMLERLIEVISTESALPEPPRAMILAGEGDIFSAGYDLSTLPTSQENAPPDDLVTKAADAIERAPFPSLAALNGSTFGAGFELACACDLRVGVQHSRYSMPPARLGIIYAKAGLARFYSLLGASLVRELFLVGSPLSSARAFEIGVLHRLVEAPHEALPTALALAQTMAHNAPLAVQGMRRAFQLLRKGQLTPQEDALFEGLRRDAFASEDLAEGISAFLEKRKPNFQGK